MTTLCTLSEDIASAIAQVAPAVVSIPGKRGGNSGLYWGDGIVITTVDAIRRRDGVEIVLPGGETLSAAVRGQDPGSDVALLQVDTSLDLPTVTLGPTDALQPGQIVFAVGQSDGEIRAGFGILASVGGAWQSWTGGHIDQLIRPDIRPFPGFAGSPLIDTEGRVLGLNTTYGRGRFAITIPIPTVEQVVGQLLQQGRVTQGYLGVGLQPVALMENIRASLGIAQDQGILIVSIEADGPADAAGMLVGDILLAVAGEAVTNLPELRSQLGPSRVGQPVTAELVRGGQRVELTIIVGER
ncbi:MAG: trypsin-like peptidase domain-containing protein [Cyanobacteria bacterium P01_A01_bin.135]